MVEIPGGRPRSVHGDNYEKTNDGSINVHALQAQRDSDLGSDEVPSTEAEQDGMLHQVIDRDGQEILVSWTRQEERKVVRKVDWILMPLVVVCA